MQKRFRYGAKLPILCILVAVVFVEWIEYHLTAAYNWPRLFLDHSSDNAVKILLVADPQLLGYEYTIFGILGCIVRWDADRYVRKTFEIAHKFLRPDLVIFLGDSLDEGEIASDEDFQTYFDRFLKVFQEVDFNKAIIIPGDNDMGGENGPPPPDKERRFNTYFNQDVYFRYKFLEVVKVNYISHSGDYKMAPNSSDSSIRIAVSHIPLTPYYGSFVSRAIPYLQPHLILSAHDHKSQSMVADRRSGSLIGRPSRTDFNSAIFNVSELVLHELVVPTCSYRMGTQRMGYGALQIESDGKVTYSVLWSPPRFRQLFVLLAASVLLALILVANVVKRFCRRSATSYMPL